MAPAADNWRASAMASRARHIKEKAAAEAEAEDWIAQVRARKKP
jgi:hypothetical protein